MVSLSGFVSGALRIIRSLPQKLIELVKACMSCPAEHSERIDDLPDECVQDDLQVEADITLVVPTEGPTSVLVGRIEELEEQVQLITLDRDAATRRLQRARGAVCQLQAELLVHNGIIRQLEAQWQAVVTGFQRPVPPRENRGTVDEGDIASVAEGPGDPEAFYRTRSGRRSKPPHLLTWVMQHQLFLRISEVLNKCQKIDFVVY
uniref:Uncharacterized protein LOC111135394 isoform X4 n=2 Tax=Crassostrea virginica TaxID=6565 RepID=A0A8B8EMM7_CRAVI|nr:uncharacterized protein LOC111135394 isoform X4 [Crassostrea virginica]